MERSTYISVCVLGNTSFTYIQSRKTVFCWLEATLAWLAVINDKNILVYVGLNHYAFICNHRK